MAGKPGDEVAVAAVGDLNCASAEDAPCFGRGGGGSDVLEAGREASGAGSVSGGVGWEGREPNLVDCCADAGYVAAEVDDPASALVSSVSAV